ncbi:MAG TPA: adenylate/guanylate cyclase domain-containing protein [Azospirillaceae bacterium]|nr:adenylate/guanylate cyclase domain-containing protein [Azospirillaceae bacterium]
MTATTPARPPGPPLRRRRRIHLPIALVLALGFGGIVALAVASVLGLGFNTSTRNTLALLVDKAALGVDGMVTRVRAQLDPARAKAEFLARQMAEGHLDPADRQRLSDHLLASLAGAPQVTAIAFLSIDGTATGARRVAQDGSVDVRTVPAEAEEQAVLKEALERGGAYWVDPVWVDGLKTSVLSVRVPVRREGRFLGVMVVAVGFSDLSRFLERYQDDDVVGAFILFDDSHVMAHPALADRAPDLSRRREGEVPLPRLDEIGDPVAAGIWQRQGSAERNEVLPVRGRMAERLRAIDVREAEVAEERYTYLLHQLPDYGSRPWTLALVYRHDEVVKEIRRLERMALIGLGILLVSVLLSLALGRAISRQIKRLARAAAALRDLDFRSVPELPDSRFREVSEAAAAFNTMVAGLRWFETYVPKALVLRLIRHDGGSDGVRSEERDVTVMFTDIKGFSTLAEAMSPAETAALLNDHFSMLAACIEAEGGTVDKFIGDAVMAFWGAPDHQPDHALRAMRAARAIAGRVEAATAEAAAAGRPPVCLRIGVHSGPVVVGNIGASSRINYTIVGDTVNAAARLEALGAVLAGEDACVVLASADTVAACGGEAGPLRDMGHYSLRGRTGTVAVWRLVSQSSAVEAPIPAK